MTITRRLTFSAVAAILLTAAIIAVAVNFAIQGPLLQAELQSQQALADRMAADLDRQVGGTREDVQALLRAAPLSELIAATPPGASPPPALKQQVQKIFTAEIVAKPRYLQLRVIGANDRGRELVRVERGPRPRTARVVPDAQLQAKGDRPYFVRTMRLRAGEVYISPIELNQEHGRIQVPHTPVLRASAPVFGVDGRPIGIAIINVDMREPLSQLRKATTGGSVYLVDPTGHYLVHPDAARDFAFESGPARRLQDDFPGLAKLPAAVGPSAEEIRSASGERLIVASTPIALGGGPHVIVVAMKPSAGAAASRDARRAILGAAAGAALVGAVAAFLLARGVSRPLVQITEAAKRFLQAGDLSLPSRRGGEVGVLADTLERMHAEIRERAEAQQRLAAIVTSTDDAILSKTLTGVITSWNAGATKLFGYTEAEAIGQSTSLIVPDQCADEERMLLDRIGAGERVESFETLRRRRDGVEVEVSVTLSPLRNDDGRVIGGSSICRDITEQKRKDAALAQQEQRLRLVIDASASAMLMIDRNRTIHLANAKAEDVFGYPREELIGQSIEMLVPPDHRAKHPEHVATYFANPAVRSMGEGRELFGRTRGGGEVPVEIGLNPIEMPEGLFTLASIIDITERKRHENELKRSNAELEQFAYIASHDLQEPLRMVASYTELLAERYRGRLDEKADKYIHYASDGARRMQQLITDLLTYSRVGSEGKPLSAVDTAAVVAAMKELFARRLDELGAKLEVGDLPVVQADESQLRQLFQNLIGNAIKFRGEAPLYIKVTAEPERHLWRFSVKDNGIGMDMRHATRIFDMFQRLHERGKFDGSGIGLAISKRIVERHGGAIWLESSPGEGSTFHFTLRGAPGSR